MGEIIRYDNAEFGTMRIQKDEHGEPLFCAADLCESLGYVNARDAIGKHVSEDDVAKRDTIDNLGRIQTMTYVTESGMYALIFGSKLPRAKTFKRWVTSEVLPSLRKSGRYDIREKESEQEIMAKALLIAQSTIKKKEQQLLEQKQKIEVDAPKVLFAEAVLASKTSILIGELAKILTKNGYEIGQKRLFKFLRDEGYLGKKGENYNIPNQRYLEMGLFDLKKNVYDDNGVLITKTTTKVTTKGQEYFINKLLNTANDEK